MEGWSWRASWNKRTYWSACGTRASTSRRTNVSQMTHVLISPHATSSNLTAEEGVDLPTRPQKKLRSAVLKRDALPVRHIGSATGGPKTSMSSLTAPLVGKPHDSCRRQDEANWRQFDQRYTMLRARCSRKTRLATATRLRKDA